MYLLSNDEWCQFWWYFSFLCRWLVWGWQVDRLILSFIMNTVSPSPAHTRDQVIFHPAVCRPASLEKTAVWGAGSSVQLILPSWSSLCAMFSRLKEENECSGTDVLLSYDYLWLSPLITFQSSYFYLLVCHRIPDFVSDFGSRSRYLDRSQGWPGSGSSRQVAVAGDGDAARRVKAGEGVLADNEAATRPARVPRSVDIYI